MTNSAGNKLKDWLQLTKLKIMIPVMLTGLTGYIIFNPHLSVRLLLLSFGILLTAISASVLNQIQEVVQDSKMNRTLNRPLPSKRIGVSTAVLAFIIFFFSGITLVYFSGNYQSAIVAIFTVIWYNGAYTYLKRITAFAVIPGAITGALPPLIGWMAAGGGPWDKPIIFLEFLFFTGQIPHFWLVILKYGDEYKKAGFPSLSNVFTSSQINRLTFTWVACSVAAALFLCYFKIIHTGSLVGILLLASVYLIWEFLSLLRFSQNKEKYHKYTILLDSYFFLVLILLISDMLIM
jgi:heme o synthase